MDSTAISTFLKKQVPLFNPFDEEQIASMVQHAALVAYEPKELIVEFGEEVSFLGVLLEGSAEVAVVDDGGSRHVLKTLAPGELFGEMEMMTGNRAVANITALGPCQVLQIPENLFATTIAANMQAITCLSRIIVERLKHTPKADSLSDLSNSAATHSDDPYGFKLRTGKPMKLLVINCGSSSLKYTLYDTWNAAGNAWGVIERVGTD